MQTLILKKDVHVELFDVARAASCPVRPHPPACQPARTRENSRENSARADAARRPLDRLDAGRPPQAAAAGRRRPAHATRADLVHFERNVEVLRGVPDLPRDSLTCDNLYLTLVPADKPPKPAAETKPTTEIASVKAKAKGDVKPSDDPAPANEGGGSLTLAAPWRTATTSASFRRLKGIKARCNELIDTKFARPGTDKRICAATRTRLIVEKEDIATDGPKKGKSWVTR